MPVQATKAHTVRTVAPSDFNISIACSGSIGADANAPLLEERPVERIGWQVTLRNGGGSTYKASQSRRQSRVRGDPVSALRREVRSKPRPKPYRVLGQPVKHAPILKIRV